MFKAALTIGLMSVSVTFGSADEPSSKPPKAQKNGQHAQPRHLSLRPPLQTTDAETDADQDATREQQKRREALRKLEQAEIREAARIRELDRQSDERARAESTRQERLLAEIREQFAKFDDRPREAAQKARGAALKEQAIRETRERLLDLRRELAKQLENRADGEHVRDLKEALERTERQLAELTNDAERARDAAQRRARQERGGHSHEHGDHDHEHGDHEHGDHDHGHGDHAHDHGEHDHDHAEHHAHDVPREHDRPSMRERHEREMRERNPREMHEREMHEREMHEREMHEREMQEREVHEREMRDREMNRRQMNFEGEERADLERREHEERLEHAALAIKHLSEAGLDDLAHEVRRRVEEFHREQASHHRPERELMRMVQESHRAIEAVHERLQGMERQLKAFQEEMDRMKRDQSRSRP